MVQPGERAPDFSVTDHLGNTWTLADLSGQWAVLWFYPKADTPGCTAEGCGFRDMAKEYEARGARILGVSFDTAEDNAAFADKFGFQFPLLCDTDRDLGRKFGAADGDSAFARRIGVIIDPNGRVAAYHPSVNARTFPAEALAQIDELQGLA